MRARYSCDSRSTIEALEGRRLMDAGAFEGYLGGGNSPVLLTVTQISVDLGTSTATLQLPVGNVLSPVDPCRFGLLKAAVPPNPV